MPSAQRRIPVKVNQTILTLSLTLALAMGAQASMGSVAEKARAAKQQAEEIQALLKMRQLDTAKVAEKASVLHDHAVELHRVAAAMERSNADIAKVQDAAEILKVLTESKLNVAQNATAKDREALRASARNLAVRAEMIAKTAAKIGG